MQKLSKLMLAAVAAIALATPAMAWDFSAAGSVSATFNMKSTKDSNSDDITNSTSVFQGDSGGISLKSSHTDGDDTVAMTYSVDYDTDTDGDAGLGIETTLSLAGSTKVGNWTASGTATQSIQDGDDSAASKGATDADTAAITLTDGKMTHKLGKAAHLASPSKATASGAVGGNQAAGANTGSFTGYSLGVALSDTMSVTLAIDMDSGDDPECLGGTDHHAATLDADAILDGVDSTCFGVNLAGSADALAYSVSIGSGSSSDDNSSRGASGSSSVMGFAVSYALGSGTIAFDYATESVSGKIDSTVTNARKVEDVEMEISYVHNLGDDSVVFNYSTNSTGTTAEGTATADKPTIDTGLEIGYKTTVGAVTLEAGYGMNSATDADDTSATSTVSGESDSDIGVKLSYSF